jgi:hypothetical protein
VIGRPETCPTSSLPDFPELGIIGVKLLRWDNMSANNGDKSRYGRQRKDKINRRLKMRALRKELVEAKKAK